MIKKIVFENGIQELQVNHDTGFKQLNLISATINKVEDFKVVPFIELILSNDKITFTSYSNLVPGTNTLNCFDLLLTATNNPSLLNEKFQTLKCLVPALVYDTGVVIDLEFDIE